MCPTDIGPARHSTTPSRDWLARQVIPDQNIAYSRQLIHRSRVCEDHNSSPALHVNCVIRSDITPNLMTDKIIVLITGGNTGIGYETVKALYGSSEAYTLVMGS